MRRNNSSRAIFGILAGISTLIGIMNSCAVESAKSKAIAQFEAMPELSDIELRLASLDGRNDTEPYRIVLNAVDQRCSESNRTALASMAVEMAKIDAAYNNEPSVNHLDGLKLLYSEAESNASISGYSTTQCFDILVEWRSNYKDHLAAEAEAAEYDRIMNAGEEY